MPISSGVVQQHKASCWDRVKMGFTMGFCVGMASAAILTGFSAVRYRLRGRELITQLGKSMVQGGGTFGVFMAIGMGIRC
ncbi:PREDICTED: reactive oxygen species modulator 1 [Polistes dominula]|uniref:Reactive oxygen species modulator 1 n=1 Tax=Polistes dominula TaxID=743375 RepID=A0ABM1J9M9_POLDO|nr:PREDICTED: reactive oxygen species modulator 1 [Polistes dominula]XP_015189167.1 PREDICTED: reactive oxygen species modulator 1 [Polistes dominula]